MGEVKKKVEKQKQKKKKNAELDEIDASLQKFYDSLPSPTLKDTLPYRITIWSFKKLINLPFTAKDFLLVQLSDKRNKSHTEEQQEIKIDYNSNHKNESERLHLELNPKKIEKSAINAPPLENYEQKQTTNKSDDNLSLKSNKDWSDKDKADLIKALVKFPSGTANRWVRVA
jgi:DnaJ family protein C protein 1